MTRCWDELRGWGGYEIILTDTCPGAILQAANPKTNGGAIIRVYPARIDADQLDTIMPLWSGPIFKQRDQGRTLEGSGPSWYMGDNDGEQTIWVDRDGRGPFTTNPITMNGTTTGTLTDWATAALTDTLSGLTLGTVAGPGTLRAGTITAHTARTIFDSYLRVKFGVAYRVNPDFTVDIAPPATLYAQAAVPVATRRGATGTAGLQVSSIDLDTDATGFMSGTIIRNTSGNSVEAGAETWKAPDGADLNWRRILDRTDMDAADADDLADTEQALAITARTAELSTVDYELTSKVQVGQRLDVWDPATGYIDMTNPVTHAGEPIFPVRIQVTKLDWPVTGGMSVWLDRRHMALGALDLTDHVAFEPADTETVITLGALPRTMGPRRR